MARRRSLVGWSFLVPLLAINAVVVIGPSLASLYYSLTKWSGLGPATYIGLDNFSRLLGDKEFSRAFLNNLVWMVMFLTIPVAMGLAGAFLLSRITRFRLAFRLVYFLPYVIASVVTAAIWKNILDPTRGIGPALAGIGIPVLDNVAFFGNPRTALPAIAFVDMWHSWGFLIVVFLAAMQAVDRSLYEAARVDGASAWREFRHITIPGILPTLAFMVLMLVVWSLLTFDYVWILTQGGPAGTSEVVSTVLYKSAFLRRDAGYAAAIGVSLTVVSAAVVGVYLLLRRRGWNL
jgi:raffinose/stachyose/melibiose transport system permease protein